MSKKTVGLSKNSNWQSERLFNDARSYYDNMLDDIRLAKRCIEFGTYIFTLDQVGESFLEAFSDAARRGVVVRVLIDGIGSAECCLEIAQRLSEANVAVRIYHPLPWSLPAYRWSLKKGNTFSKMLFFAFVINRRDHRKLCIVDRESLWCGSYNITDSHLSASEGGGNWQDYGAKVEGDNARYLSENFKRLWFNLTPKVKRKHFGFYFSNLTLRINQLRNRVLMQRIRNAEHCVWICSAYFAPSGAIIAAIREASRRGIDVRILVAKKSDIKLFPLLTATYFSELIHWGVKVFAYDRKFLHAKVAIIDSECIIGSTNFNHRSFYHDLETDIVLQRQDTVVEMKSLLEQDMQQSIHVTKNDLGIFRLAVWFGWLPRLIRYWM